MKPILIIFFITFSLLSFSCKNEKTTNNELQNKEIKEDSTNQSYLHKRDVAIEKQINENQVYKNDLNYSFKLLTKDTIIKNVFTNEKIRVELIKNLQIFNNKNLIQYITNINELTLYYPENNKKGTVKLEDKNNDGFLDLWLEFSPQTRQYDSDYIIFIFNDKKSTFSKEREYLLKNLTEKEFKELYTPQD